MDKQFIVELQGRSYPTYPGILAEAHERGLQGIACEIIQIPAEENGNTAIVRATVTMKDGSVFVDLGDANPRNTNARIATALLRMASTRAKGRALRDAVNVGQTLLEELPDLDDAPHPANGRARAAVERQERAVPVTGGAGSTWTNPETGEVLKRDDLLRGVTQRLAQAKTMRLQFEAPSNYHGLPAEDLYHLGLRLVASIREAEAVSRAAGQSAEVGG